LEKILDTSKFEELMSEAREASKYSYSPYSKFPVGAAVLYDTGNIYKGANVENASYGLSICAERNAISTAITAGETGKLVAIAVYSPEQKNCFPCGACRQWLSEFKGDYLSVIVENETSCTRAFGIDELLPYSFELK